MLSRMPNWGDFAAGTASFLSKLPPSERASALQAIFYRNAAPCLGLDQGSENRRRLDAFYRRWLVPPPAWMMMLDEAPG